MSTIEKWAPAHLWRAWDTNWQLAGQWEKQPPMSELADAIALTVDYPSGARDSWRVHGEQLVPEFDTWMRHQNRVLLASLSEVLDVEAGIQEIIGETGEKP